MCGPAVPATDFADLEIDRTLKGGLVSTKIFFSGLVAALLMASASLLMAQSKPEIPAPIPPRVLAAKKVFIANGGQVDHSTDETMYSGSHDRAYNQLFAALKAGGRYDLVSDPSDADVVFEIEFAVEVPPPHGTSVIPAAFDPQFRLSIRDPKSNALLWRFNERAQWAILQGNRDKNFDLGLGRIVSDLQMLPAASSAPAGQGK